MHLFELFAIASALLGLVRAADDDYNTLNRDGSYEFGYNNPDSFHHSQANRNNVVRGRFGARNPGTGAIDTTVYTAGPRGYRPRGKDVVRNFDLNQSGARPVGSKDDPYFDPNEDPSYNFGFRTPTYTRQESANRVGDVTGRYTYFDDENDRHDVQYIAGKNTGFHVLTPFPDSNTRGYGNGYFRGRGDPPRGRTSIQRGLDGSYKFVSVGPDQRRTETSDAVGNVRGSYTYLDEKGVQHAVHYIAGPGIGYRVLKNVKGPHLPTIYPFGRPEIIPSDFYDSVDKDLDSADLFDAAASGHVKPVDNNIGGAQTKPGTIGALKPSASTTTGGSASNDFGFGGGAGVPKPTIDYDDDIGLDELFQNKPPANRPATTPSRPRPSNSPPKPEEDDGSYKPGSYGDGDYDLARPSDINKAPQSISGSISGTKPKPQFGPEVGTTLVTASKPSTEADDFDFDFKPAGRPILQLGTAGSAGSRPNLAATVIKNLGDSLFSVPPGASVRAHVQSIDLFPFSVRTPSPSEQFRLETGRASEQYLLETDEVSEQLNEETSHVDQRISSTEPTAREATTTTSATTSTTPKPETTSVIVEKLEGDK